VYFFVILPLQCALQTFLFLWLQITLPCYTNNTRSHVAVCFYYRLRRRPRPVQLHLPLQRPVQLPREQWR
jgi:hypothetical protein